MDTILRRQLQDDILNRYDNEEYWNKNIIEEYEENKCDHEWSWKDKNPHLMDTIDELGIPVKCDKCGLEAIEWWIYSNIKDNNGNTID